MRPVFAVPAIAIALAACASTRPPASQASQATVAAHVAEARRMRTATTTAARGTWSGSIARGLR
jgi:hypothetical protein